MCIVGNSSWAHHICCWRSWLFSFFSYAICDIEDWCSHQSRPFLVSRWCACRFKVFSSWANFTFSSCVGAREVFGNMFYEANSANVFLRRTWSQVIKYIQLPYMLQGPPQDLGTQRWKLQKQPHRWWYKGRVLYVIIEIAIGAQGFSSGTEGGSTPATLTGRALILYSTHYCNSHFESIHLLRPCWLQRWSWLYYLAFHYSYQLLKSKNV